MTTRTSPPTTRTDPADHPRDTAGTVGPAPLVRVRGLRKRYGDRWVLDGLDLDVAPGEIVALLGANGAGKTTLLTTICGLVPARAGEIVFEGRALTRLATERIVMQRSEARMLVVATLSLFLSILIATLVGQVYLT